VATFWVGASGNDANDGTSFANRKATWQAVMALATAKGDVVNVVADDGPLTVSSASGVNIVNRNHGTSFSDPGLTVQGVDNASANPDLAELRFQDNTTSQTLLSIDNAGASDPAYIILQGLYVNWAALTSTVHTKHFVTRINGNTDNNIRIQYNKFEQEETAGGLVVNDHALGITDGGQAYEIRYNYFLNMDDGSSAAAACSFHHRGQGEMHHNVFVQNGAWNGTRLLLSMGSNDGDATDHRCYNNTYIAYSTMGASRAQVPWSSVDSSGSTGGDAVKHLYNNVHADFRASGSPSYAYGSATGDDTTYDRLMGYSLFCNPNSLTYANFGPYQIPWDPDDADSPEGSATWGTDASTTADVFQDKATPWDWENINGSGYTMTLIGDLRIKNLNGWRSMSQSGGVPGAISDPVTVGPSLEIDKAHVADFQVEEIGTYTFEVRNVGDTTATSTLTLTDTLPTGISYRAASGAGWTVSVENDHTITATWTGNLDAAEATEPLVVQVDVATAAFPSVTNEVTVTSADAGTAADSDITPVAAAPSETVPGHPSVLLSEAAPGFPVIAASLQLRKNRELYVRQDSTGENTGLGRLFSAFVDLPAGATDVELPMILQPTFVMLETDQDLVMQINSQTFVLRGGGCFALTEASQISTFSVSNRSAFKVARLQYCGAAAVTQGSVPDPSGGRGDDGELN
jgi:uncharacterized repeat protein (TIGR01451 family)